LRGREPAAHPTGGDQRQTDAEQLFEQQSAGSSHGSPVARFSKHVRGMTPVVGLHGSFLLVACPQCSALWLLELATSQWNQRHRRALVDPHVERQAATVSVGVQMLVMHWQYSSQSLTGCALLHAVWQCLRKHMAKGAAASAALAMSFSLHASSRSVHDAPRQML